MKFLLWIAIGLFCLFHLPQTLAVTRCVLTAVSNLALLLRSLA